MIDLAAEFCAACSSIDREQLSELQAAGIRTHSRDGAQLVGLAPIQTRQGGLFDLADDGPSAVIVPAGRWDGLTWQLDDLIAFRLAAPGRWWRRLGMVDVLGDLRGFTVEPKTLRACPLDWLRAGGRGLCILDWLTDPVELLTGAGPIVAESELRKRARAVFMKAAAERFDMVISNG